MKKEDEKKPVKNKHIYLIVLHFAIFILSLASLCSKAASAQEFPSFQFILLYCGVIAALFVYAIVWQQVLKHMLLVVAFANKVATLFWSFIYGVLIFHEEVRINMIIGIIIVAIGVLLVIGKKQKEEKTKAVNDEQ